MEDDREIMLEFRNVGVSFGSRPVLNQVSFQIRRGEFCYLIGPTGSGKSSILKLVYCDLTPTTGQVLIAGKSNLDLKKKEIPYLRRKLGVVFQDFQLLPDKNAIDNIRFAMRATGWKDKTKIRERSSELLMRVGLGPREKSMPHQLSGGEQQRVTIARSIINDPVVLLADEPTGNLDPVSTENILEILLKINLGGTAILMATHELDLIRRFPARTLELKDGGLVDHPMGIE